MNKYNQELPADVEAKLDAYIERIKNIKWFSPASDLKRETVETQVSVALKAFGCEATVEYRKLQSPNDWDAAWDAARGAAWDAARGAAWDAAWDAARGAARDAAWGAYDILALNLDGYKNKYPEGNFINLIPLWEAGLYPCGVIDGKFVIYVPASTAEYPTDLIA